MDIFSEHALLLNAAKKISFEDYLQSRGLFPAKKGYGKLWYYSPFNEEKTPSFCLYESKNRFIDYSSGNKGDIVDFITEYDNLSFPDALHSLFKGSLMPINAKIKKEPKRVNTFKEKDLEKWITSDPKECNLIKKYAESRGIKCNYVPCKFYHIDHDNPSKGFLDELSLGFIHYNEEDEICGIKFRFISPKTKQRFSSRGQLRFHHLPSIDIDPSKIDLLFITESETSSNSLYEILSECGCVNNFHILCIGGSWDIPNRLPEGFENIKTKKIIIDYDGGKNNYDQKILELSKFGEEIRLPFDKGEDINYLYVNGRKNEILAILRENGIVFAGNCECLNY